MISTILETERYDTIWSQLPASFQLAHQPKELSYHAVFKVILQLLGLAAKFPYYYLYI